MYNEFFTFMTNSMTNSMDFRIYSNTQEMKEDFIKVRQLDLDYFQNLMIYLIGFYSFLVLVFIFHHCFNFVLKRKNVFKIKIYEIKIDLKLFLVFRCPNLEKA